MNRSARLLLVAMVGYALPSGCAQRGPGPDPVPADTRSLSIDLSQARTIALTVAPGEVVEEELETEDGRQIYSFDIDPQDGSGNLAEVHVDRFTGEVLGVESETPEQERKERHGPD